MNILKISNGITLIALVITIITLLILAGVSVGMYNNSVINKAELATVKMKEASIKEKGELKKSDIQIVGCSNITVNLKGNVNVGDYINYPIEYDDTYTRVHYTSSNGWRVIDDGIMQRTSGSVKIISSHIPIKFSNNSVNYKNNVDSAIYDLTTNFENKEFYWGFTKNKVNGSYFNVSNLSKCVTTLTLEDLNCAYNLLYGTERNSNSIEALSQNDDLFCINQYWIASKPQENNTDMYFCVQGIFLREINLKCGIRPVVVLKDELEGKYNDGLWEINY